MPNAPHAAPALAPTRHAEIAVIGAGVIGLAAALRLAQAGREVVLIDPEKPGSGASFGNAGTIADYAVLPVAQPGLLRDLPRLLTDRDSPLALRPRGLWRMLPWLAAFSWNCLPHRCRANAAALAEMLADAGRRWQELAQAAGGGDLLKDNGCLYLIESESLARSGAADAGFRRRYGVQLQELAPPEVAALEPALPAVAGGAHYFPTAMHVTDPGAMMALLADACTRQGVRFIAARVDALTPFAGGVELQAGGERLHAARAVIAAGAASAPLARQAGERVLLDTERGYHLEFDMPAPLLSRPAASAQGGFYMIPMHGRLRVAGAVELGGTSLPPDKARLATLERGARRFFPDLPAPSRSWSGFRPSVPGMLPLIRRAHTHPQVVLAFGHGHLGLTLAPLTAERVAVLLDGGESG
ncbi:MAG: FAD-binding oxidoreductase [Pararhodobacter sp.]|nr:FAD-binding oxidoreductase [Pararhodobacter sp.]